MLIGQDFSRSTNLGISDNGLLRIAEVDACVLTNHDRVGTVLDVALGRITDLRELAAHDCSLPLEGSIIRACAVALELIVKFRRGETSGAREKGRARVSEEG